MDNCQINRENLHAYVDGELSDIEMIKFERHMAECGICKKHYEETMSLKDMLEDVAIEEPPSEFESILHSRLLEEGKIVANSYRKMKMKKILNYCYGVAAVLLIAIFTKPYLIDNIVGNSNMKMKSDEKTVKAPLNQSAAEQETMHEWIEEGTTSTKNSTATATLPPNVISEEDKKLIGAALGNGKEKSMEAQVPTNKSSAVEPGKSRMPAVEKSSQVAPFSASKEFLPPTVIESSGAIPSNTKSAPIEPQTPVLNAPQAASTPNLQIAPLQNDKAVSSNDISKNPTDSVMTPVPESGSTNDTVVSKSAMQSTIATQGEETYNIVLYATDVKALYNRVVTLGRQKNWNIYEVLSDKGNILIEADATEVAKIIEQLKSISVEIKAPDASNALKFGVNQIFIKIEIKQ